MIQTRIIGIDWKEASAHFFLFLDGLCDTLLPQKKLTTPD